jgi:hypothetical protein
VLTVHDRDGACTTGPIALRPGDLGVVQAAISKLAIEDEAA